MTLIEVTLVIAILLGLIAVLFIGVNAYRKGSDRALCILNITTIQKSLRSHQNMYGDDTAAAAAFSSAELFGADKMIEAEPQCPSSDNGSPAYAYAPATGYPAVGTVYASCEVDGHAPSGDTATW